MTLGSDADANRELVQRIFEEGINAGNDAPREATEEQHA